ncbi:hypothetical protein [Pseudomonas sp. TE50-2]|uniref:hypothetical protein n=1 Tax=Pseudomonas sp. TE50-2 TaxID=3142707 RepID=UPI0034669D49
MTMEEGGAKRAESNLLHVTPFGNETIFEMFTDNPKRRKIHTTENHMRQHIAIPLLSALAGCSNAPTHLPPSYGRYL